MIRLPAALEFRSLARLAAYAVLAALVTAALFAADGAYRWFQGPAIQAAAPTTGERSGDATATAEAQAKPSPVLATSPQPETPRAEERATEGSVSAGIQEPASGSISKPAGAAVADGPVNASPNVAVAPKPDAVSPASKEPSAPADLAHRTAQPPLPPRRPEMRTPPAKQATARERAAPRRPVQAATTPSRAEKPTEKPNVYWERDGDSQLGFAPSLRRRTCDPATGHMPMQCYYPRESRDQFPAKPLN